MDDICQKSHLFFRKKMSRDFETWKKIKPTIDEKRFHFARGKITSFKKLVDASQNEASIFHLICHQVFLFHLAFIFFSQIC